MDCALNKKKQQTFCDREIAQPNSSDSTEHVKQQHFHNQIPGETR